MQFDYDEDTILSFLFHILSCCTKQSLTSTPTLDEQKHMLELSRYVQVVEVEAFIPAEEDEEQDDFDVIKAYG